MAASTGIVGFGTTLGYSTTSGGSYTSVAEILDMPLPETEAEAVDFSHMASPSQHKEKKPGWDDTADYEFDINFNKAQLTTLHSIRRTSYYWKITTPDNSTWVFPGYIAKIGGESPMGDKITAAIMITVTGPVVYTAGA